MAQARTAAASAVGAPVEEDIGQEDFFSMANLSPQRTGLPTVIRLSERGVTRHDVRVTVMRKHGRRVRPEEMVSVSVRPDVVVMAGTGLASADLALVKQWIELNRELILDYWSGDLLTDEAIDRIVPLTP